MKIEFYDSVTGRTSHRPVELSTLINKMKTSHILKGKTETFRKLLPTLSSKSDKDSLKARTFSCVQFSGTFKNTGASKDIDILSGLIVIDFDHISIDKYRPLLENDPYTYILFISPSGDGIKVIIKHSLTDPNKWYTLFEQLSNYYKQNYYFTTKQLDPSGKDISRQCFIPFDPSLYVNEQCNIWDYVEEETTAEPDNEIQEVIDVDDDLIMECYYFAKYFKDKKVNVCDSYEDWLRYGFSLCQLGEDGRQIFHLLSSTSPKYNKTDVDNFFDDLLEKYDPSRTTIEYYRRKMMTGIARYSIYTTYDFIRQ